MGALCTSTPVRHACQASMCKCTSTNSRALSHNASAARACCMPSQEHTVVAQTQPCVTPKVHESHCMKKGLQSLGTGYSRGARQVGPPAVKDGPEDSHPDEVHVAERRTEAVQQEFVRVWAAARAAPKGAAQPQGLVCDRQRFVRPDAMHTVPHHVRVQAPLCRLTVLPSSKSLQGTACTPARAVLSGTAPRLAVGKEDPAECQAAQEHRRQRDALMPCSVISSQVEDACPLVMRLSSALTFSDKSACPGRPLETSPRRIWCYVHSVRCLLQAARRSAFPAAAVLCISTEGSPPSAHWPAALHLSPWCCHKR